jgi:translation initiation factor IF-2
VLCRALGAQVKAERQEAARLIASFPVIASIIPEFIFNRGGPGEPFVAGMQVKEGILRRGTPLCVINPAPAGSADGAWRALLLAPAFAQPSLSCVPPADP